MSILEGLAILIGSHLTREPTASPVLTKCWKSELMLATNFDNLCPKVTTFGSQNFGYQIWFCTRLISVIYPLIQTDPSTSTYPLCVPTAWGLLISRLNCVLWSQAHMYFNSLRPCDRMAAKFWSSLLQPMAHPQYGAKWVPEPIVT